MTAPRREQALAAGLAIGLALLGCWMYRPGEPRPFDTLDFSEFIPLLRGASGLWGRTVALSAYYVHEHGRLNLLSYAALAAKWTVLGEIPVRWQWARAVEMLALGGLLYSFLRRLALGPVASVAGASIFLIGRVAGEGWTRMTMGEVLGTLCALGALHVATRWREWGRPVISALATGAFLTLAVLAKEMLIGVVPFVLWIGVARTESGALGAPRFGREELRWGALTAALPLVTFLVALYFATHTAAQGFSSLYGTREGEVGRFIELILRPWFLTGQRATLAGLLAPGNALFVLFLILGLRAAWRTPELRAPIASAAGAAAILSLSLAILYLPWPYFNLYYAIPFLLGTALLFAVAVDALMRQGGMARMGAFAGVGLIIGTTAPVTAHFARTAIAQQQVDGELVAALAQHREADEILVARRTFAPLAWAGTGATLRRYALATGAADTLPPARDISCPEAYGLMGHGLGRSVLITYGQFCGTLPGATVTVTRPFRYVDVWWTSVTMADDSVIAQLLVSPSSIPAAPR